MISQARLAEELSSGLIWLPEQERRSWAGFNADPFASARNPAGIRITPDTALRSTVILACCRVLGESVASLPLNLFKRLSNGGKELATAHPLFEVLRSTPNSWQTSYEWREQMMLHACLHGNAYCYLKPGKKGAVSEIVPLHPSRMQVERLPTGKLRYRYSEEQGTQTVYRQDQIMHLRWLSDDGVHGMVPVQLAEDAIALSRACEIFGNSFFGNNARPGVVLETDQVLEQEAAAALRENWERMHRGVVNSNRTAVLMGGLHAHELGTNNNDSQWIETRRLQIEECCRCYRIPPHMVGDLSRSSFSNIEQQSIDFLQHSLQPWLTRIEAVVGRDIIQDSDYFVEFDPRGLLRGDVAARASYMQTVWNLGVASINELRAWESLNPIDGGDVRFVQLNMQTLEQSEANAEMAIKQAEAFKPEGEEECESCEASTERLESDEDSSNPPGEETVAEVSLNGAQIQGLLTILQQHSEGLLGPDAAKALISASFPSIPKEKVERFVADTNIKVQPADPGEPEDPEDPEASEGSQQEGPGISEDDSPLVDPEEEEEVEQSFDPLLEEARNCGTGAIGGKKGFQSGNTCAGTKGQGKGGQGGKGDSQYAKKPQKEDSAPSSSGGASTTLAGDSRLYMPEYDDAKNMTWSKTNRPKDDEFVLVEHSTTRDWLNRFVDEGIDATAAPPDSRLGRLTVDENGNVTKSSIKEPGLYVAPAGSISGGESVIIATPAKDIGLSVESKGLGYEDGIAGLFGANDAILQKQIPSEEIVGTKIYDSKEGWKFQPNPDSPIAHRVSVNKRGDLSLVGTEESVHKEIFAQLKESDGGGYTVHPVTGRKPASGYQVSTVREAEMFLGDAKEVTPDLINKYRNRWRKELAEDSDLHLGGWYNKEDGKVYIDLSKRVSSRTEALSLAKKHRQYGVWNNNDQTLIETEDLWKNDLAEGEARDGIKEVKASQRTRSRSGSTRNRPRGGGVEVGEVRLPRKRKPGGDRKSHQRDGRAARKEGRNCGTGAIGGKKGFQSGNTCAGTKGKGKKKQDSGASGYVKKSDSQVGYQDGQRTTISYVRNTEPAPPPGPDDSYQQNLEPKGRYVIEKTVGGEPPPGWESGSITFEKPLVIKFNENDEGGYDENSWKAKLSERYGGKTGSELSEAIIAEGYDGIITTQKGETSEIVDLTRYNKTTTKVNSEDYGMTYSKDSAEEVLPARYMSNSRWDSIEETPIPRDAKIISNEKQLNLEAIERVVSGSEPMREGYPVKLMEAEDGSFHVVDGHHRIAMHHELGDQLSAKVVRAADVPRTADVTAESLRSFAGKYGGVDELPEMPGAFAAKDMDALRSDLQKYREEVNRRVDVPTIVADSFPVNSAVNADQLVADAKAVAPEFEQIVRDAAVSTGTAANFGPGDAFMLKKRDSLDAKVKKKASDKGLDEKSIVQGFGDAVRGTLIAETPEALGDSVRAVAKDAKARGFTVEIENKYSSEAFGADPSGYGGVHMKLGLKTNSGRTVLAELQFHPATLHDGTMKSVKETSHANYKRWNGTKYQSKAPDVMATAWAKGFHDLVKKFGPRDGDGDGIVNEEELNERNPGRNK